MSNLRVVESKGLIKVYETDTGEKVVNARELHVGLGNKRRFADWVKQRISEVDALENEDYILISQNCETRTGGTVRKEYILKLDIAKEMAMLERNDKGKQYRRYFIELEKKYKEQSLHTQHLSPQLQLLINLELEQKQLKSEIQETKQELQGMRDVIALDTTSWRTDARKLIAKIANSMGGYEYIRDVNAEIYRLLDQRMAANVKQRLTNKRRRMADEGVCKSKRDKLNKLDVIADDKKLIQGYVAIVKEMAVKNGVA